MTEPIKPSVQIFDAQSIAIATFLGSPIVGGLLWAINEARVGRMGRAVGAFVFGLAVTGLMMGLGAVGVPQGASIGISLGATVAARTAAQAWETQLRAEDRFGEITYASRALAAAAGALGCIGVLGLVLLTVRGSAEGDPCEGNVAECVDATSALWCDAGVLRHIDCHGAGGCNERDGRITCSPALGDACLGESSACAGTDTWIRCDGTTMVRAATCRGANGCTTEGDMIYCDQSIGVLGEPCRTDEGAGACTADASAWLSCIGGTWQSHRLCRGPNHCSEATGSLLCDEAIAAIGDACGGDGHACSEDGQMQLVCQNGAMVREAACPSGCTVEDGMVSCPNAVSPTGAP